MNDEQALRLLSAHIKSGQPVSKAAFELLDKLLSIKRGKSISESVLEDLKDMQSRIRHLESASEIKGSKYGEVHSRSHR